MTRSKFWIEIIKKRMQESYWRFIWCICICCTHIHSQGFQRYWKQKGFFLSFLENLADTKRKFSDVAHISTLHLSTFHDCVSHGPFSTGVSAGDRPGDLGQVKTPEILHFLNNDGLLFNHVWGKTLRDGSTNLFAVHRIKNPNVCPF